MAKRYLGEALALADKVGHQSVLIWALAGLAGVAVLDNKPDRAASLWGAAENRRKAMSLREGAAAHETHERLKAQAREQLGDAAFEAAWKRGAAAPLEQVISSILKGNEIEEAG
jgi:hypothetical protein